MTERSVTTAQAASPAPTYLPPADIYETKDAIVMLLDMPGAAPDSLNVSLDRHELTIEARTTPTAPQGYALVHAEYQQGSYERAFTLSDQIDGDRIDAMLKDGVLRLTLPKAPEAAAKKIAVKSA
jgi:HSP20 family protein